MLILLFDRLVPPAEQGCLFWNTAPRGFGLKDFISPQPDPIRDYRSGLRAIHHTDSDFDLLLAAAHKKRRPAVSQEGACFNPNLPAMQLTPSVPPDICSGHVGGGGII